MSVELGLAGVLVAAYAGPWHPVAVPKIEG